MYMYTEQTRAHTCTQSIIIPYSEDYLTWHFELIPPDEVWVQIGGDKGQGSMFQVCNVPQPNSCKNSVIFSIFEASDTATNLNLAHHQFKSRINSLTIKVIWQLAQLTTVHPCDINPHQQRQASMCVSVSGLCLLVCYVWSLGSMWYIPNSMMRQILYM